jgi:hypothetical protein
MRKFGTIAISIAQFCSKPQEFFLLILKKLPSFGKLNSGKFFSCQKTENLAA